MTINQNNFEAYLLDYLEGNLDPLLTADLMAFLAEHPEFEKMLPDYDTQLALSDTCAFGNTALLKKDFADVPSITPRNFDEFCVASCENLLGESDRLRLSAYLLQHPEKQQDLELYRQIRLVPDRTIRYHDKAGLKKAQGMGSLRYLYYAVAIAASFLLIFLLVNRKPAGPVTRETGRVSEQPAASSSRSPGIQPMVAETVQETVPVKPARHTRPSPPVNPAASEEILPPVQALAELEPITGYLLSGTKIPLQLTARLTADADPEIPGESRSPDSDAFADSFLGSLLGRLNFWKTAETALAGFNYLTESQLSVGRTTDEQGKVTGLLIESESFTISGTKIK
jgi:hypothetical protein